MAEIIRPFGMRVLSGLLFLSALASVEAAGLNVMQKLTDAFGNLAIANGPFEYHSNLGFSSAMQKGEQLKEEALKARATLEGIVKMLDDEMERIILFVNKEEVISWITQVFVCFYEIDGIYTYDDLYEIALEENAKNFLKASIAFNHCETFEEFLPFLISSYKSNYYNEEFWTGHKVDWSKVELSVILETNNPKFLEDFLSNRLPFTTNHRLSSDKILDLVAEHDFLDIFNHYKTLGTVTFEQLHERIEKLVQFGSVKLLRALHGSTGENLNLQNHFTIFTKLSGSKEDWEFLKEQGYQYAPVNEMFWAACSGGHMYILKELYETNEKLIPHYLNLEESAKIGDWGTIKWAIDNGVPNKKGRWLFQAILNEHFEFIQFFEDEYNFTFDLNSTITWKSYYSNFPKGSNIVQALANKAAGSGRSRVVEWISDKFNVLPEKPMLYGATVKILKLLKLKKPETFDADLLSIIEKMSSIKWLWNNYCELFTDEIKEKWINGYCYGKDLRWIHKNWKMLPKIIRWNISVGDLEFFIKETNGEVDISRVADCAVKEGDSEKVKYLISKYPSCLKMEFVGTAMEYGHVEIVDMLDKHFGHQFVDLWKACASGHLEILKRSLERHKYSLGQIGGGIFDAIKKDQSEIVEYMINNGHIIANSAKYYAEAAIELDSIYAFKLLIKNFDKVILPEDYFEKCWKNRSFKILKFILPKLSKSKIKMLLEQDFDERNYHLRIIVKEEYEKRTQGV